MRPAARRRAQLCRSLRAAAAARRLRSRLRRRLGEARADESASAARRELVARLGAAYAAGTYRVDPRAVAAAVLRIAPHEVLQ